jgi:hypothetical protein
VVCHPRFAWMSVCPAFLSPRLFLDPPLNCPWPELSVPPKRSDLSRLRASKRLSSISTSSVVLQHFRLLSRSLGRRQGVPPRKKYSVHTREATTPWGSAPLCSTDGLSVPVPVFLECAIEESFLRVLSKVPFNLRSCSVGRSLFSISAFVIIYAPMHRSAVV